MPNKTPSIREIRNAARTGGRSAEQSVQDALERIAAWDGQLKSFVCVDAERALADARHLDRLAALGVPKGPLFGVPVGIKDIIDIAGLPTGGGSLTRQNVAPAAEDAVVVQRLRAAGAIIVGKTATVEYAFGGWGTNETMGTPLNPWDLETPRVPGGSSNGSGVAVAAGLVAGALGSDTGGSIRLPSSFSGLVGLKTTPGLIDKKGVLPLCDALDTIGVMTRCVEDAAIMFDAISGQAVATGLGEDRDSAAPFRNLRIGIVGELGVSLHPDTRRIYEETQLCLKEGGAVLVPVRLPNPLSEYAAPCGTFLAVESYLRYGNFAEEEPNRLGDPVRTRILSGKKVSGPDFLGHIWRREQEKSVIAALFETVDAILMPATAMPAPALGQHDEHESPAVFTRFANYFDLAAIALPMGLSAEGLPVGMQIVVPGLCEKRALIIAHRLETANGGPILCPILGL